MRFSRHSVVLVGLGTYTFASALGQAPATGGGLDARVAQLARAHAGVVTASQIGVSAGGRPLHLLRLAGTGSDAPVEPAALMIVAGLDARHQIGVDAAMGVAEALASKPERLRKRVVYIVPCLNPDGFALMGGGGAKADFGRAPRALDADHDARVSEDPGEDLNGDGSITMMRVKDPPPGSELVATLCDDPDEPRAMKSPDASKGERAVYAVLTEGIDNEGDGAFNEDGVGGAGGGGIDLGRNFPSHWPEHTDGAGRYPLDAPEALALATWMLEHREIAGVIEYGRLDTLVNLPKTGDMDASKQVPIGIENEDKSVYEGFGAKYKEITGINEAPREELGGSFTSWVYTNLGVPSLATQVWVRPDGVKAEKRPPKLEPPPPPAPQPPAVPETLTTAPDASAAAPTAEARKPEEKKKPEPKTDDQKWLRYFDERVAAGGAAGFADWKVFEHPTLGAVEIGGFVPGARGNPPGSDEAHLVAQQAEFVEDVLGKFAQLSPVEFRVKRLAPGIWRLDARLSNTGWMPTHLRIAEKTEWALPATLRLDVPPEVVVSGEKVQRAGRLAGNGGVFDAQWTIRAGDGSSVKLVLTSSQVATREVTIELKEESK